MSTPVEKIKERLTITEVIESYIKLDRSGSNLKGKCPFHNEKTPSFFVSPDRGSYYCFGCGAKGDMFSFVQAFEGLDFMGSLKLLANKAGIPLVYEKPEIKNERERLYEIMEVTTEFYEAALSNTAHLASLNYLKNRGLTEETIKEFRLGFAENDWRTLYTYLKNKKYTDIEIEKAGLIKRKEEGDKGYYDRFRGRIMFPIADSSGRVIAFTGRIIEDDGKSAKYLNSPETPIFTKASVLYGIDKAKLAIRKMNYTILVEGQMDLILSHQAGFKNTVAGSGTALTDSLFKTRSEGMSGSTNASPSVNASTTLQNKPLVLGSDASINNLGIIKRISPNIIMVYDSDKAGINAALRSSHIALSLGMDVKIGELPSGLDPADLIVSNKEQWKDVLKNAKPVVEFSLNVVIAQEKDPRKQARLISEKVLPFLASIQSHMEKAHFVAMIKDKTGLSEEAIWQDLKRVERDIKNNTAPIPKINVRPEQDEIKNIPQRKDSAIKKVFGVMFWQGAQERPLIAIDELSKKLRLILGDSYEVIEKEVVVLKNELLFEAEVMFGGSQKLSHDIELMLIQIEEDVLKDDFAKTMQELSVAERDNDTAKTMALLVRCQELSKKIGELMKRKQ